MVTAVKVLYSYNGTSPLAYVTLDIGYSELDRLLNSTDNPAGTLLFLKTCRFTTTGKADYTGSSLQRCRKSEADGK